MTAKTVNRLTQKQVWAISKHIEENIELYTNADYKFIANEMNKIFDYEITVSNIQHIKEVTGLQIGRPSKRNSPKPKVLATSANALALTTAARSFAN